MKVKEEQILEKLAPLADTTIPYSEGIPELILSIAGKLGIPANSDHLSMIHSPDEILKEDALTNFSKVERPILALIIITATYQFLVFERLPKFSTIEWLHGQLRILRNETHRSDCVPHWSLLDLFDTVNTLVFIHVPVPITEDIILSSIWD